MREDAFIPSVILLVGLFLVGGFAVSQDVPNPPPLPIVTPTPPDGPYMQGETQRLSVVVSPLVGVLFAKTNIYWLPGATRKVGLMQISAAGFTNAVQVYKQFGRVMTGLVYEVDVNGKTYSQPLDHWKELNPIHRYFAVDGPRKVILTNIVVLSDEPPPLSR